MDFGNSALPMRCQNHAATRNGGANLSQAQRPQDDQRDIASPLRGFGVTGLLRATDANKGRARTGMFPALRAKRT